MEEFEKRKYLKYYGYIPCEPYDFRNGRPATVVSCKSPQIGYHNHFTNRFQNTPLTEEYKSEMRQCIAAYLGPPETGGKFWNCYFGQWVPEALTEEYHASVIKICREVRDDI